MGTFLLNQIKKQASCFLQETYKNARMVFSDVTAAELLAEEATSNDPWGPDARTMTKISKASFYKDDYWRIVYVLHKRLDSIDWKHWRQSYKALILLEFLLTHGHEAFAEEFICDSDVIEELGTFRHVDEKGFNWGLNMQKRSDRVLELLEGGETLRLARLKALKITKEIQGFGSTTTSPSSASSSDSSRASSFGSYFSSFTYERTVEFPSEDKKLNRVHLWNGPPIQEKGSLLESEGEEGDEKSDGLISGICSKLAGISPSKSCYRSESGIQELF
ncbi:epsin-3 [Durio zibethinus]|uniref:Epsin-3 n=1 Tax=Durio zibethinus TaxID=66656 RepID=A0A6P6A8M5_DURZI|nr:epsin-3 [Durio zibethinus]